MFGRAVLISALSLSAAMQANASVLDGFEDGLIHWQVLGDVSIQTSAIGLNPTQGEQFAFVTTLCDRNNPPALLGPSGQACATTVNEHPYSGQSSPAAEHAREFLGLPASAMEFGSILPGPSTRGESGALKMRFYVPAPGEILFDWNRIGRDGDSAYFTLWSDDPASTWRVTDWVFSYSDFTGSFGPSGVDLCSRYYGVAPPSPCSPSSQSFYNVETGWSSRAVQVDMAGWYWLGFGLGEIAEGTAPTVLALDNVRFQVPEPGALSLLALGLALGWPASRRRDRAT